MPESQKEMKVSAVWQPFFSKDDVRGLIQSRRFDEDHFFLRLRKQMHLFVIKHSLTGISVIFSRYGSA